MRTLPFLGCRSLGVLLAVALLACTSVNHVTLTNKSGTELVITTSGFKSRNHPGPRSYQVPDGGTIRLTESEFANISLVVQGSAFDIVPSTSGRAAWGDELEGYAVERSPYGPVLEYFVEVADSKDVFVLTAAGTRAEPQPRGWPLRAKKRQP